MTTTTGDARGLRAVGLVAAGIAFVLVVAALAAFILTQTDTGRRRVLGITLDVLGKGIRGKLSVQRIEGNLLTGAKLHGVALRDDNGDLFLLADSAYLDYDPRTLTTPRIQVDRAVLYNAQVYVWQIPGDTLWNYQKLFPPGKPGGAQRYTLLESVRVVNGMARVQIPWEPEEGLSARQRRREVALALSDTSPYLVHRVGRGYLHTINVTGLHGGLSRVRFAPGSRAGSYFGIDSLAGRVQFFRTPFEVKALRGELELVENRVEFRAPVFNLPNSYVSTFGVITLAERRGGEPKYDVTFNSDSVALRDLRWLYRRFPADASGAVDLTVETRPEGLLFLARDLRMRAPGTRVRGDFGMITGDTVRFVDVNLRAEPLRTSVLEGMLPDSLPVRGLLIGGVEIRGPQARRPSRPRS
ncbi:MAG TPA: hypothetical protein VF263_18730 [Longimicrobiaceae bacterium]